MEGSRCYRSETCSTAGYVAPVVEYGHDEGCSVTGGVVYRGAAIPALAGRYFYADYCTALLRSFRFDRARRAAVDHWDWKKALDPDGRLSQIASFGEDEAGEVYVVDHAGAIYRVASD